MLPEHQLQYHALQAAWWVHSATNKHNESRKVVHGDNTPFTPEDYRDDAMQTARRHIELFREVAEHIYNKEINRT